MSRRFTYYGSYASTPPTPVWVGDSILAYSDKLPTATYLTKDGSDRVSSWIDQTTTGNNATQGTGANQPLWTSGGASGGLYFLGTRPDYLQTSNVTIGASFTMSVWVNRAGGLSNQILLASSHYYGIGFNGNFILRVSSNSAIAWASYNGRSNEEFKNFSATIGTGFTNVRVVCNGTTLELFLNNVSKGTMTHTKSLDDLDVGGLVMAEDLNWTNNSLTGYLGNVQVWNKAQDATERTANYDELKGDFGL